MGYKVGSRSNFSENKYVWNLQIDKQDVRVHTQIHSEGYLKELLFNMIVSLNFDDT